MSTPEPVKAAAAKYRQQSQAFEATARFLDQFEDVIEANPELKPVLLERLAPAGVATKGGLSATKNRKTPTAVRAKGKSVAKLLAWYQSTGNRPATIKEMATAISLGHAAIRQMIYMTYADKFDKVGKKEGTRESTFVPKKGEHL